ncbi:MAG: hypothetical protein L6R42_006835 [Xanthoria sp. 1 TBL-2021]|nr:MAG: hypothetical protein L6R42_006835 [Xanthoria sp. 1 TBL-2021]
MADMSAEDAFLQSMKDQKDAEEAVQYEADGAGGKQTESISSDEYDPAQAVPDAFSPYPAQDNLPPLGAVNQPNALQSPGLPSNGQVAATGLKDQAVDEDDGRSQSRSMSNSSSSSSPVNIQVANVPSKVDTPTGALAEGNGSDDAGSAEQAPKASAVTSSDLDHSTTTETLPSQDDVSIESLLVAVPNGVSQTFSESSALLPESGREGQAASVADAAPVPPAPESSETKGTGTDVNKATSGSALPKARLPHDKIGILEDRTREDPRGDMDAWLELISEYRKRNKIQEARATYERFFLVFPAAAEQWVAYARMENDAHNLKAKEDIFVRVLRNLPNLQLWSAYLDHIRRRNNIETDTTGDARRIITQAYDVALDNIGFDKDSGYLWQEYIQFLKSRPGHAGGSSWQEQQKMDQLRAAYQRAVKVPTQATQSLWKEYDQFEMGINKATGRTFLQKESPAYVTARSSYIQLSNITRNLRRTTLARLPPALGFDGDREYAEQLEIWKKWIQWEKDDPLVLKEGNEEERKQWRTRVVFVYQQAVMDMRFWPELWYDAAEFCFQNDLDPEGNEFLAQGVYANPESCLLAFRRADRVELTTSNGDGDDGIVRRGAAVREPYDKVLDALYELITKTKDREGLEIAKIEAQAVSSEEQLPNGNHDVEEDEDGDEADSKQKRKAAQIEAVKGVTAMQIRVLSKTITFVWIALMRAMRRVQGKGKINDKIGGSRQIFNDARKRGRLTHDIYVASAMIEYHCYEPEATKKIFERGLKLFPEDEMFALEYIKHLTLTNDHINARVIFETVVNKLTSKPENVPRAKPLYAFFHDFESKYGELTQIIKLEKRMKDHFPDDPTLSHFSRRFVQPGFDPTAIRPIISTATQTRPKPIQNSDIPLPTQVSPPRHGQKASSPKRALPLDESDTDAERPRKAARGESPLKGAAGRRLEQQKRNQQPQYDPVLLQPPTPSLPPAIMHVLSNLPRSSHYPINPRFIPHKVVEHVQKMNLETARRAEPPGSSQQKGPPPLMSSRPPQQMPQPLGQYPPSMPPGPPTGTPNPYNGGYHNFSPHTQAPSTYPQQHQMPAASGSQYYPGPNGQAAGYGSTVQQGSGYPYGQGNITPPLSRHTPA